MTVRADAVSRIAISVVAVASGTGAFVASLSGQRNAAIGLALLSGALGVTLAIRQGVEEESEQGTLLVTPPPVAPELPGVIGQADRSAFAGLTVGRMMGRG